MISTWVMKIPSSFKSFIKDFWSLVGVVSFTPHQRLSFFLKKTKKKQIVYIARVMNLGIGATDARALIRQSCILRVLGSILCFIQQEETRKINTARTKDKQTKKIFKGPRCEPWGTPPEFTAVTEPQKPLASERRAKSNERATEQNFVCRCYSKPGFICTISKITAPETEASKRHMRKST